MFVSAAAGGGFLVPLEPTVSGKNRTAKDDTHDTTIGWDSLVLYSKGLVATFNQLEETIWPQSEQYTTPCLKGKLSMDYKYFFQ